MKIFIIAGEDSGDKLGSAIIDGLNNILDTPPNFVGIGGSGIVGPGVNGTGSAGGMGGGGIPIGGTSIGSEHAKIMQVYSQEIYQPF